MIYTGGRRQGYLLAATVKKAHGLRGYVTLNVLSGYPDRLLSLPGLYAWRDGRFCEMVVEDAHAGNEVLVKFRGVDDRDAAQALRGVALYTAPKDEISLPEGEYYIADLIGCQVALNTGEALGVLREVMSFGAADVYAVEQPRGGRILFPALKRVLCAVDTQNKRISVDKAAFDEVAVYEDA